MRASRLAPGASNVPALSAWMDSASSSLELKSKSGSHADSDIRHVDLDSANVEAQSQVLEVSVHQGPVEAVSAGPRPWIIWFSRRNVPCC